MRSVADDLRIETVRAVAKMPVADRISLSLRLGDDDVALYRAAHGVSEADSRAALARARAIGRLPSSSNDCSQP